MSTSRWVKDIIQDELIWRTQLKDHVIETIVDESSNRLNKLRLAVVPTYLSDEMYQAQQAAGSKLDYQSANRLYVAAIQQYISK